MQCNTNKFEYLNIRIIATEYYIFEYEYQIFLFRIYLIFVFGQVAKNEYIRYSYSVRLGGTNILDIRIRSGCEERIYSIFGFSEIFLQIYFYLYSLTTRQYKLHKYETKLVENLFYGGRGVFKSLHFIYSILVFVQVAWNKYIRYSYSVRF